MKFENRNFRYAIVTISKSRKRKYCHNEYADGRSQQKNIKYKKNQMKRTQSKNLEMKKMHWIQSHRMDSTKSEPYVNYGL